jgi:hypothetical protein
MGIMGTAVAVPVIQKLEMLKAQEGRRRVRGSITAGLAFFQ